MVGEFDPDKTESRNELCWRRNSLLADSQRHPARLPDRCCSCRSRHPLPRVLASPCCRRSIARARLLDSEKVGLPSLDPLRHSCRGPRVRNPLQPYRRSSTSLAAPGRPVRLSSLSRADYPKRSIVESVESPKAHAFPVVQRARPETACAWPSLEDPF